MIKIQIETFDPGLADDLSRDLKEGALGDGSSELLSAEIKTLSHRDPGLPFIIQIVLGLGTGLTANLVSSWLHRRTARRAVRLKIKRKTIEVLDLEEKQLLRVIEESIEES